MENGLYNIDCREFLSQVSEPFIDLIVTSPPYNVGIDYDFYKNGQEYKDYLDFIENVFFLCYNKMKDNRVLCLNIGRNYKLNTPAHLSNILEKIGFNFYCSIFWIKPVGSAVPSAMCQQNFPYYLPYCITEDILVYTKGKMPKTECNDEILKLRRKFLTNLWDLRPEHSPHHPAVMPKMLAYLLIKFFSKEKDLVFDPFAGIGTTLIVAKENNRNYVGCEISPFYVKIGNNTLKQGVLF